MAVTVKGMDTLKAKLRELRQAAREERQPALMQAAGEIAARAREMAPKGETLELSNSISAQPAGKAGAKIVVDSDHAAATEFGTAEVLAQPYLRPAVDEAGPGAIERAAKRIGKALESRLAERG